MKRPAFMFYPADWRKDPGLSVCSMAARGLVIEMMCIAHQSDEYSYLTINGIPMTAAQIARIVGESPRAIIKLLAELAHAGVFSRDERGAIFSRRMVKDEHIRNVRADSGRLGGNPRLLDSKDKQEVKQTIKQKPTPSVAVAVASSFSSEAAAIPLAEEKEPEPAAAIADAITARAIELAALLRARGAAIHASDLNVRLWAESGISDVHVLAALETAQQRRAEAGSDQPIGSCYLNTFINDPKAPAWWSTNELMLDKADELGISEARPGESMSDFRARITNAMAKATA